jgi:hypothetical protein
VPRDGDERPAKAGEPVRHGATPTLVVPTSRPRHTITETPPVQEALDELRSALNGGERIDFGELLAIGAHEGEPAARGSDRGEHGEDAHSRDDPHPLDPGRRARGGRGQAPRADRREPASRLGDAAGSSIGGPSSATLADLRSVGKCVVIQRIVQGRTRACR